MTNFRTNHRTRNVFKMNVKFSGPITVYDEAEIPEIVEIANSQGKKEIYIRRRGRAIDIYYGEKK